MNNTTPYYERMSTERADLVYVELLRLLTRHKRYRQPDCTARELATEMGIHPRDISAAVRRATNGNFASLLNGLRLRDVERMRANPTLRQLTIEEISRAAGFASRQAYYVAKGKAEK